MGIKNVSVDLGKTICRPAAEGKTQSSSSPCINPQTHPKTKELLEILSEMGHKELGYATDYALSASQRRSDEFVVTKIKEGIIFVNHSETYKFLDRLRSTGPEKMKDALTYAISASQRRNDRFILEKLREMCDGDSRYVAPTIRKHPEYLTSRKQNRLFAEQKRTDRNVRPACPPYLTDFMHDLGEHVADGVYLSRYLRQDGRKELKERYKVHLAALHTVLYGSGGKLPDGFIEVIEDYNRFWQAQTKTRRILNPASLEKKIEPFLKGIVPFVHTRIKGDVRSGLFDADVLSKNMVTAYLTKALDGNPFELGLNDYVTRAKSGTPFELGLENYLNKAMNGTPFELGLRNYLNRAEKGTPFELGLEQYMNNALHGTPFERGFNTLKECKGKAPKAEWDIVDGAHKNYERVMVERYEKFVRTVKKEHEMFCSDVKKRYNEFVAKMEKEAEEFKKRIEALTGPFKKRLEMEKKATFKGLANVMTVAISGKDSFTRINATLRKIGLLNKVFSEFANVLTDESKILQSSMNKEYMILKKSFTESYKDYRSGMADRYAKYKDRLQSEYKGLKGLMADEYDRLKGVFHKFSNKQCNPFGNLPIFLR